MNDYANIAKLLFKVGLKVACHVVSIPKAYVRLHEQVKINKPFPPCLSGAEFMKADDRFIVFV